jgi:hypothetical protein
MTEPAPRVVPNDELTADDRAALGWAFSTEHPVAVGIRERTRDGAPAVLSEELALIRQDWDRAGRPPPQHHVHRTRVTFSDGTAVTAVSFQADDPYARDEEPSFGLYLDARWDPPWRHAHVDWPDFGLPTDVAAARSAFADLLDQARTDATVELGCLGGHGRTGTALACLAVLTGTPAGEAVAWVRSNYCEKAVETDEQARFVASFELLNG